MASRKEFDVNSLLPKAAPNPTLKKIKRGVFVFKCFLKLSIAMTMTAYYGHLLYQKQHNDMAMSQTFNKDYNLLTQSDFIDGAKNLGNMIAEPFLALLGKAEGKSYGFYLDNKGFATGYGYNPTQNDANYNRAILKFAEVDPATIDNIVNVSSKYKNSQLKQVPVELQNVKFSEKQIKKMALFAKKSYEQDFLIVFKEKMDSKGYNDKEQRILVNRYQLLTDEQKAVLIHMTYKVGQTGLTHYNTFFSDFIGYLNNPTTQTQEKVAKDFVYHYKKDGKILVDERVDNIHHDLFMKTNHNEQIALTTENSTYIKHPEKLVNNQDNNKTDNGKTHSTTTDANTNKDSNLTDKQKGMNEYSQANNELQEELKEKLSFNHFYNSLKQAVAEHKKYKLEHPHEETQTYYVQDDNNSDDDNNYTNSNDSNDNNTSDSDDQDDSDDEQVTYQVTQIIRMTR
jgi:hypothetical protein